MGVFKRLTRIFKSNFNDFIQTEGKIRFGNFNTNEKQDRKTDPLKCNNIEAEFYANLEIPYGASFLEIKNAYRKMLKKYHPDLYGNDRKKQIYAEQITKKLNEAFNYFENKTNKEN